MKLHVLHKIYPYPFSYYNLIPMNINRVVFSFPNSVMITAIAFEKKPKLS